MADIYGAVTDDALNRVINLAHARAPFLFNYVAPTIQLQFDPAGNFIGTQDVWLACAPVPDSLLGPGVPKFRRVPPFSLPGIPIKLPYSVQIIDVTIDFHPGDQISLPAQLLPPLRNQNFALKVLLLFGLACVDDALVEAAIRQQTAARMFVPTRLPVLPVTTLECFTLDVYAFGRLTVQSTPAPGPYPLQQVRLAVDGLEIVDIAPTGLEGAIECYLKLMLKGYILPQVVLGLQSLVVSTLGITLTPHLTHGLPNNPAIEQDEIRVWLDVDVT